jgi:hypothetical protein
MGGERTSMSARRRHRLERSSAATTLMLRDAMLVALDELQWMGCLGSLCLGDRLP